MSCCLHRQLEVDTRLCWSKGGKDGARWRGQRTGDAVGGWWWWGVAALWVVCFLQGWDTMPPVFRQAHRSLFYNRGGAAINGQMM